jgi:hypothetical protein
MARNCTIRKYSTDGVLTDPEGNRRKVQIFCATCIPHTNFKQFLSRSQRDKWDCPGHHIEKGKTS